MTSNKKKSALGSNPLSQGIFSKTESVEESRIKNQESTEAIEQAEPAPLAAAESRDAGGEPRLKIQESISENQESRFLREGTIKERLNLRLPTELNDWLDELVKQGKRKHGRKIPKEVWMQAALELFKEMSVDWSEIEDTERLRLKLAELAARVDDRREL